MRYRTPGRHALRRRASTTPWTRNRVLGGAALAVVLVVVLIVVFGGGRTVTGQAAPAAGTSVGAVPLVPQSGWPTLTDSASGLSYQIPPTGWATNPQVGEAGSVTLTQGAELNAYTCGNPTERLLRGMLGSGSAPRIDPTGLADSIASAAAAQFYKGGSTPPTIKVDPPQSVRRTTGKGATLTGVLVRAVASQHADPCLATRGEILVLVLQFGDHDGVLVVNGDLAGGPATPAPATDGQLRAIVGTTAPTN